jgi:hypothetical protein
MIIEHIFYTYIGVYKLFSRGIMPAVYFKIVQSLTSFKRAKIKNVFKLIFTQLQNSQNNSQYV